VTAAAAWAAAEPLAQRCFRTPYSDVRALGGLVARRHWWAAGLAIHLANGAIAGIACDRFGLRGWKTGVLVFEAETVATWPLMTLVERFHPDRRDGTWPPLLRNGRVFAQEAALHALFGAILGARITRQRAIS
jgi:hypothetical protein